MLPAGAACVETNGRYVDSLLVGLRFNGNFRSIFTQKFIVPWPKICNHFWSENPIPADNEICLQSIFRKVARNTGKKFSSRTMICTFPFTGINVLFTVRVFPLKTSNSPLNPADCKKFQLTNDTLLAPSTNTETNLPCISSIAYNACVAFDFISLVIFKLALLLVNKCEVKSSFKKSKLS